MDDLFQIFNEIDALVGNEQRPRVIRARRDYINEFDKVDFRKRFRLGKEPVLYLLSLVEDRIKTRTNRNSAISPLNRLLLTLRYYATGSFLVVVGDFLGVSEASASRIVGEVTEAIASLRPQFIKFSRGQQHLEVSADGFFEISRFPKVIGAIDCTHVPIKSPGGGNAEVYRCRKGFFSINTQIVVNYNFEILDIVARWPGSSHDQTIYNNSRIKQRLASGEFGDYFILGDRGYELTNQLLTPLAQPITRGERLYNEAHIRTRNVIERSFGILKNRFPVLIKKINIDTNKSQAVIVACAVLHNIAIQYGDLEYFDDAPIPPLDEEREGPERRQPAPRNARLRSLIDNYFARL